MPRYVPIQDMESRNSLNDTDYVPVSDGETSFTIPASKFKEYAESAATATYRSKMGATENIFTAEGEVEGVINANGVVIISALTPEFRTTDFLPVVPGEKYIFFTQVDGLRRVQVVGFYTAEKVFISRQVSDNPQKPGVPTVETPPNCYYMRLTSLAGAVGFPDRLMVTKGIICPYVPSQKLQSVESTEKAIYDLQMKVNGIESVANDLICPYNIGVKDDEDVWLNSPYTRHIMIPVNEGDTISVTARNVPGVYALLKSRRFSVDEKPDFVNQYTVKYSDIGEPTFVPVEDEPGHYVQDRRHVVAAGKTENLVAVPDSAYLYCSYSYPIIEQSVVVGTVYNGLDVTINGVNLFLKTEGNAKEEVKYETVFFDDFDTLDTNVWTLHTEPPPEHGKYKSRFFTNTDNVRCEQSTLIMKVSKVPLEPTHPVGQDGWYIPKGKTRQDLAPINYHAPYISTCDSFAIPYGRISARLRMSKPLAKEFFVGGFWTFGQNARWGYAHEMDVIETTQDLVPVNSESKSGVEILKGSVRSIAAFNLHTRNQATFSQGHNTLALISISRKVSQDPLDTNYYPDEVFYRFRDGFDMSDWHTYAVEWDKENIFIFVDDMLFASYNAESIGAVDENGRVGFYHPQDIRFNIKCDSEWAEDDGYLFVDWVKAEAVKKTPCLSISHSNITIPINGEVYIEPSFNADCSNMAFTMESDNNCVTIEKFVIPDPESEYDNKSFMVVHKIIGASVGTATITLTSANGITQNTFTVTVTAS